MTGYGSDADATERAAAIAREIKRSGDALMVWFVAAVFFVFVFAWLFIYSAGPAGSPSCAQISAKTQTRTTVTETEIATVCQ